MNPLATNSNIDNYILLLRHMILLHFISSSLKIRQEHYKMLRSIILPLQAKALLGLFCFQSNMIGWSSHMTNMIHKVTCVH